MADPATPPAPAAAATPPATNDGENGTFSVTKDDWEKLTKTLNSTAAELRKLKNQAPATPPATPVAIDDEPKTQKAILEQMAADLKKEREEARKEREDALRIKKENGIRDAIKANNVTDPDAIEVLFDHIDRRHGSKISLTEGKILLTDELDESKEIGDFISELLKSPKGKLFKPEKVPGPNTRGGRGNSAPIPGQKSFMEMSMDERLKLQKDNPAGYLAAVAAAAKGS